MAGRKAGAPSKSAFIRAKLEQHKDLSLSAIQKLWKDAGGKGEVSGNLYYQVRSKMGVAKRRTVRKPPKTQAKRGRPRKETKPPLAADESSLAIKETDFQRRKRVMGESMESLLSESRLRFMHAVLIEDPESIREIDVLSAMEPTLITIESSLKAVDSDLLAEVRRLRRKVGALLLTIDD